MRSDYCYAHFTDEETGRETLGDLAKVTELVSGTAAMQTLESTLSTTRLSSETEIVQILNTWLTQRVALTEGHHCTKP